MNYSYYINQIIRKLNNANSDAEIRQILEQEVKNLRALNLGVSNQEILRSFNIRREYWSLDNRAMTDHYLHCLKILEAILQEPDKDN